MSTITARSIRRASTTFRGRATLRGFSEFLRSKGVSHGFAGRPAGSRVLTATAVVGAFLSATFRHPTKRATAARFATVSWRSPETA